jgi:cyclopropane fatty-acyl-phospholipid synthase-like methyltransferase
MTAFFNEAYKGVPPWDIGHPQAEFVALADEGRVRGRVLDIGCGTGENALFFATRGLEVWGLDAAPLAVEKAKTKARERGLTATLVVGDALNLDRLDKKFDTITDSGLFHVFTDEERVRFVESLRSALNKDGTYFMLCFSDKEPAGWGGPRRVSEKEIRETFKTGWEIDWIREARFESNFHEEGGHALLSSITLL